MSEMGVDKSSEIERAKFLSAMMVGSCPACSSDFTHDCESKEGVNTGSTCEVAKQLDAVDVGHCDNCCMLWCLECGEMIGSEPEAVKEHFGTCTALESTRSEDSAP
jgi:hypothetical protein